MRYLTSGESHGASLNAIIEGYPANVKIDENFINDQLANRQKGYGRGGRMKIETDKVKILSGVRFGLTTGAPICIEIENKDHQNWLLTMNTKAQDEQTMKEKKITALRPGHADFAGASKYNQKDIRNILERSSARETATRVAVGAFSKILLKEFGIEIISHVVQIGDIKAKKMTDFNEICTKKANSELNCADFEAEQKMKQLIDKTRTEGNSLGGKIEIIAKNIPVGLGSYVHWDRKLDGLLAQAIMSIPAVKSVEIGEGIKCAELLGSKMHDAIFEGITRKTNHAGGIEGGMSNGEDILISACMKAIPTMTNPLPSVDFETKKEHLAHVERADVCAVSACGVVAEAMVANVLANAILEKFGGDSIEELKSNYNNYLEMLS